MPTTLLTDRLLERTPPKSGRIELWDTIVPGFGVRITARQKSFFFSFRSPRARTAEGTPVRRRVSVGEFPSLRLATARSRAAEIRDQVDQGLDPYFVEPAEPVVVLTFESLAQDYMERYAKKRKRSWRNDDIILRRYLLPAWGSRAASDITARDVRQVLQGLAERAPVQANRVHSALRSVFSWGVSQWELPVNPGRSVSRLSPEFPRERVLSREELRALWLAWNRAGGVEATLLKLRLLTAQRGSQLCRLQKSELEETGEDVWWKVPSISTKSRRPYRVWLGPWSRRLLAGIEPDEDGSWFSWDREREGTERSVLWKRGVDISRSSGVQNWQPRDLRRTAATLMAQNGVSRFIIKRVLGHSDREITAVYDLYSYDREVKEAVLILERTVREIVGEAGG